MVSPLMGTLFLANNFAGRILSQPAGVLGGYPLAMFLRGEVSSSRWRRVGFSLLEMLVAITVLAILSALLWATSANMRQATEAAKASADAGTLNTALRTALAQGSVAVSGSQVLLTFADATTQFAVDAPVATMVETQALLEQLGLPASGYVGVTPNNYQGYSSVIWLTASASGSGLVTFVSGTTTSL